MFETEHKTPSNRWSNGRKASVDHRAQITHVGIAGYLIKQAMYRLADENLLFYLNWIENNRASGDQTWLLKTASRRYATWAGNAFEGLCLKHVSQIKKALGIERVETSESSWFYRAKSADDEGAQVDLIIDRIDHCTNLCELKFSELPFVISKSYAAELERKQRVFREKKRTRNTVFLTLVTAAGVKPNAYSQQLLSSFVELRQLFETV